MARTNISIAEALEVLTAAGIELGRIPRRLPQEPPVPTEMKQAAPIRKQGGETSKKQGAQPTKDWSDYPPGPLVEEARAKAKEKRPRTITLYAKHSIASGEPQQLLTFGPGKCTVPAPLADALLHQDMLAREADARLLETTPRHYLIVRRSNASGHSQAVGLQVTPEILDNIGLLDQRFLL